MGIHRKDFLKSPSPQEMAWPGAPRSGALTEVEVPFAPDPKRSNVAGEAPVGFVWAATFLPGNRIFNKTDNRPLPFVA
jgi:hypothetical protein